MSYPLEKDPKSRWSQYPLPSLIGGLNTDERADVLRSDQVVDALNLFVKKKELVHDTGYVTLGTGTLASIMKRTIQYITAAGGIQLIGISKNSVYIYSTTHSQWQYVKGTASTTLNGAQVSGTTNLVVASSTGFLTGEKVGITLTTGAQQLDTITNVPDGTHITIAAPGLTGNASNGAAVVRAVVLTGSDNYPVMAINVPSNNWLVFTNNVDYVKRYDGTDCINVPGLTTTSCVDVALYNSALFLFATTEGGTYHPTRVRRSEIGDPTTWAGGTAGFDDLLDTSGAIIGADVLGPYLVVYKTRTIYRGEYVNVGGLYYQFNPMLHGDTGEGLLATDAIVNIGSSHIFLGNSNVYRYIGDFSIEPLGDDIFTLLFSNNADVNTSKLALSFGVHVEGLREVWFFYPSGGATWPDSMLRYNLKNGAWTRRNFTAPMTSAGVYSQQANFAWSGLVGSWASQVWQWNSRVSTSGSPIILLCPTTTNIVVQYNFITTTDNGTTVSAVLETRDFLWSGGDIRTDRIEMYCQGLSILIQYSTDQGSTWRTWNTVSNSTLVRSSSHKQVVCDGIRFRFTCSDANFKMRWMSLTWRPESV